MTILANVASSSAPSHPIWSILPDLLWIALVLLLLFVTRRHLATMFEAIAFKLKTGSSLKVGLLEIGPDAGPAIAKNDFDSGNDSNQKIEDKGGIRENSRNEIYENSRRVMLVHRIQRSAKDGQIYDSLIYLIPHRSGSLAGIKSVEYFFGEYWENKIFISKDRARGFPIIVSAYGPFLCTARLNFTDDDKPSEIYRYIDFEMGVITQVPSKIEEKN